MSTYSLGELANLTPKGRKLIKACYDESPEGCRDEDCSPPCYARAGISFDGWCQFVYLQREIEAATPLEGFE